jgi:hypothetical protein
MRCLVGPDLLPTLRRRRAAHSPPSWRTIILQVVTQMQYSISPSFEAINFAA